MRIIDIDVTKPELQAVSAAQELLEANYPIVFPGDALHCIFMRYSADNAKSLHALTGQTRQFPLLLSEDADWQKLAAPLSAQQADFILREWPGVNLLTLPKSPALTYPEGQTIMLSMPSLRTNRAFHTLLQLCDFPLLVAPLAKGEAPALTRREAAAHAFAEIEYGFWDLNFSSANTSTAP